MNGLSNAVMGDSFLLNGVTEENDSYKLTNLRQLCFSSWFLLEIMRKGSGCGGHGMNNWWQSIFASSKEQQKISADCVKDPEEDPDCGWFCEGLDISAFHGKLRLGYLALALFEVQTKDKGPFKNNRRNYFSFHVLFCFIKLIMFMYTLFTLRLWFKCVYMHKWEIQALRIDHKN